ALDAPLDMRRQTEHRLQERALARTVGTDDRGHLRHRNLSRQVMHGGVAIVADREIDQLQDRVHSAHQTHSHNPADTQSASDTRAGALMARSRVPGETKPCMSELL